MVQVSVGLVAVILIIGVLVVFGVTVMMSPKEEAVKTPPINNSNVTQSFSCRIDTDCTRLLNKTLKTCMSAVCTAGKCAAVKTENCCGNNITEEIENDLPGNKCTCPQDYGACNATVKYTDSASKLATAKYITRACVSNYCEVQYVDTTQRDAEVFNVWTGAGFIVNAYVKYSNPFYIDRNEMQIDMRLVDYELDKIKLPIIITEVRLMEGTKIMSRITPNTVILSVGQTQIMTLNTQNYDFLYPEEAKTVKLSIDYEYVPLKIVTTGSGASATKSYVEQPVERKTYVITLTDKITFLDKTLVE